MTLILILVGPRKLILCFLAMGEAPKRRGPYLGWSFGLTRAARPVLAAEPEVGVAVANQLNQPWIFNPTETEPNERDDYGIFPVDLATLSDSFPDEMVSIELFSISANLASSTKDKLLKLWTNYHPKSTVPRDVRTFNRRLGPVEVKITEGSTVTNEEKESKFYYVSIIDQLNRLLSKPSITGVLAKTLQLRNDGSLAAKRGDVYSGQMYQQLSDHFGRADSLSLAFSTDGVPIFKVS